MQLGKVPANPKGPYPSGRDMTALPQHVALIMDGNGRWAHQRNLPRLAGHHAGTENIRRVIQCFALKGIKYLTVYAFSTENWSRPAPEVNGLMQLLSEVIAKEAQALHKRNIRIRHLGRTDRLAARLRQSIANAQDLTKSNTGLTLSVAFDYGGRGEIIEAVRRLIDDGIPSSRIDGDLLERYLYTSGLPDPDLIIRTAGELRLSNFLLWQAAYAEYYSTTTLWPDFDENDVDIALENYRCRLRHFGNSPGEI